MFLSLEILLSGGYPPVKNLPGSGSIAPLKNAKHKKLVGTGGTHHPCIKMGGRNFVFYRYRVPMKKIVTILMFVLPLMGYSQYCSLEGHGNRNVDYDVMYKVSAGMCYHYNSVTLDFGYKRHYMSFTSMIPVMGRMTHRMVEQEYLGYTYDYPVRKNVHLGASVYLDVRKGKPVERIYVDRRLYGIVFLHGSVIHVYDGMVHLIGGVKLYL